MEPLKQNRDPTPIVVPFAMDSDKHMDRVGSQDSLGCRWPVAQRANRPVEIVGMSVLARERLGGWASNGLGLCERRNA